MLFEIARKLWIFLPARARLLLVRISQRKFTVSVAAVVLNHRNEVLVLDHYIRPGASWGLPGGFIEPSEDALDAIRRELEEETGLQLDEVKLLEVRTTRQHIEILYRARAVGNASIQSREIRSLGWFSSETLPDEMNSRQKDLLKDLLSGID